MLLSIISLALTVLFIVFIFWCISAFWAWLGRGKRLKGVCDQDLVSDDVKETVARLEALKAAQELARRYPGQRDMPLDGPPLPPSPASPI